MKTFAMMSILLMVASMFVYLYNVYYENIKFGVRLYGIFQHANYDGWYSMLGIIAFLYLCFINDNKKKIKKYILYLCMAFLIFTLLLSRCRSALGALVIIIFLLFLCL